MSDECHSGSGKNTKINDLVRTLLEKENLYMEQGTQNEPRCKLCNSHLRYYERQLEHVTNDHEDGCLINKALEVRNAFDVNV